MITLRQFTASAVNGAAVVPFPSGVQVPVARSTALELYAAVLQDQRTFGLHRHGHIDDWTLRPDAAHTDAEVAVVISPAGLRYMLPNTPTHAVERLCPALGCDQDRPENTAADTPCPEHPDTAPGRGGSLPQGLAVDARPGREEVTMACTATVAPSHPLDEPPAMRGREASRLLTEVRTVLSRAVSALPEGPTEPLYTDDGRRPLYDECQWLRAYDPDHEEIAAALRDVVKLLSPWRRTGRLEGTERQRQAQLVGVTCSCQRLWAGRVGQGHVPRAATP